MKGNIENGLKQSLEKFEMPYNPKAWEALKVKLDTKTAPIKRLNYKMYAAAAGVTALVIGSILYFNTTEDNKVKNKIAVSQIDEISSPTEVAPSTIENNTQKSNSTPLNTEENIVNESTTSLNNELIQNDDDLITNEPTNNSLNNDTDNDGLIYSDKTEEEPTPTPSITFKSPSLKSSCIGLRINIVNDNDFELAVLYPNGTVWKGKKHSNAVLMPNTSGTYKIGYYQSGKFIEKETFVVNDTPSVDFQFENSGEKFNNGLPQTIVSTNSIGNIEWNIDGQFSQGNKAVGHLFKKGQHPITLSVTDVHGCKQQVTKIVSIEDNFNLMAVNSFIPTDVDPLLNRFMPFSLTQREVEFELLIFDPKDGHLLYKTNDASTGWDGIDQQTGSLVRYNAAYIWKVILYTPAPGEQTEYAGTIVPRERRR